MAGRSLSWSLIHGMDKYSAALIGILLERDFVKLKLDFSGCSPLKSGVLSSKACRRSSYSFCEMTHYLVNLPYLVISKQSYYADVKGRNVRNSVRVRHTTYCSLGYGIQPKELLVSKAESPFVELQPTEYGVPTPKCEGRDTELLATFEPRRQINRAYATDGASNCQPGKGYSDLCCSLWSRLSL